MVEEIIFRVKKVEGGYYAVTVDTGEGVIIEDYVAVDLEEVGKLVEKLTAAFMPPG